MYRTKAFRGLRRVIDLFYYQNIIVFDIEIVIINGMCHTQLTISNFRKLRKIKNLNLTDKKKRFFFEIFESPKIYVFMNC